MPKSTIEFAKSGDNRDKNSSRSSTRAPLHFAVHKPGCHFESCCGICNLFPGVLMIAFCQILVGSILLTLILTHGKQYDDMHQTTNSQFMSVATGAVLSGVTGAGILLLIVALTENCRAMLVYLLVATLVWIGVFSLAVTKIGRACVRFKDASKIKDDQHRLANLACVSGLFTFLGAELANIFYNLFMSVYLFRLISEIAGPILTGLLLAGVYFFSFLVVFSFYHYRYVRRAILLHEAECE